MNIDLISKDQLTRKYQEFIKSIDNKIIESDPTEEIIYKVRIQNIIDRIKANRELGVKTLYLKDEELDIIYSLMTRELGKWLGCGI